MHRQHGAVRIDEDANLEHDINDPPLYEPSTSNPRKLKSLLKRTVYRRADNDLSMSEISEFCSTDDERRVQPKVPRPAKLIVKRKEPEAKTPDLPTLESLQSSPLLEIANISLASDGAESEDPDSPKRRHKARMDELRARESRRDRFMMEHAEVDDIPVSAEAAESLEEPETGEEMEAGPSEQREDESVPQPVEPTEPVELLESMEQAEPVEPAETVEPEEPVETEVIVEPAEPLEPVDEVTLSSDEEIYFEGINKQEKPVIVDVGDDSLTEHSDGEITEAAEVVPKKPTRSRTAKSTAAKAAKLSTASRKSSVHKPITDDEVAKHLADIETRNAKKAEKTAQKGDSEIREIEKTSITETEKEPTPSTSKITPSAKAGARKSARIAAEVSAKPGTTKPSPVIQDLPTAKDLELEARVQRARAIAAGAPGKMSTRKPASAATASASDIVATPVKRTRGRAVKSGAVKSADTDSDCAPGKMKRSLTEKMRMASADAQEASTPTPRRSSRRLHGDDLSPAVADTATAEAYAIDQEKELEEQITDEETRLRMEEVKREEERRQQEMENEEILKQFAADEQRRKDEIMEILRAEEIKAKAAIALRKQLSDSPNKEGAVAASPLYEDDEAFGAAPSMEEHDEAAEAGSPLLDDAEAAPHSMLMEKYDEAAAAAASPLFEEAEVPAEPSVLLEALEEVAHPLERTSPSASALLEEAETSAPLILMEEHEDVDVAEPLARMDIRASPAASTASASPLQLPAAAIATVTTTVTTIGEEAASPAATPVVKKPSQWEAFKMSMEERKKADEEREKREELVLESDGEEEAEEAEAEHIVWNDLEISEVETSKDPMLAENPETDPTMAEHQEPDHKVAPMPYYSDPVREWIDTHFQDGHSGGFSPHYDHDDMRISPNKPQAHIVAESVMEEMVVMEEEVPMDAEEMIEDEPIPTHFEGPTTSMPYKQSPQKAVAEKEKEKAKAPSKYRTPILKVVEGRPYQLRSTVSNKDPNRPPRQFKVFDGELYELVQGYEDYNYEEDDNPLVFMQVIDGKVYERRERKAPITETMEATIKEEMNQQDITMPTSTARQRTPVHYDDYDMDSEEDSDQEDEEEVEEEEDDDDDEDDFHPPAATIERSFKYHSPAQSPSASSSYWVPPRTSKTRAERWSDLGEEEDNYRNEDEDDEAILERIRDAPLSRHQAEPVDCPDNLLDRPLLYEWFQKAGVYQPQRYTEDERNVVRNALIDFERDLIMMQENDQFFPQLAESERMKKHSTLIEMAFYAGIKNVEAARRRAKMRDAIMNDPVNVGRILKCDNLLVTKTTRDRGTHIYYTKGNAEEERDVILLLKEIGLPITGREIKSSFIKIKTPSFPEYFIGKSILRNIPGTWKEIMKRTTKNMITTRFPLDPKDMEGFVRCKHRENYLPKGVALSKVLGGISPNQLASMRIFDLIDKSAKYVLATTRSQEQESFKKRKMARSFLTGVPV